MRNELVLPGWTSLWFGKVGKCLILDFLVILSFDGCLFFILWVHCTPLSDLCSWDSWGFLARSHTAICYQISLRWSFQGCIFLT